MENIYSFSHAAEEMHASAGHHDEYLALMEALNREDASEAMAEARDNDGVSGPF